MKKNFVSYEVQKVVNNAFDNFGAITENETFEPSSHFFATYEDLNYEIQRLIDYTKSGKKFDTYHSLFIFGHVGVGKSEICKRIAEENGCIYHKLEIQKIPLEVFEGFPIIKQESGEDTLKLVPSNLLPPANDENVWLLHLDEFNKADTAKMAAVMNLVLTGEIGGAADYDKKTKKSIKYKLPEKTIIIGSGNFQTQDSVENMNVVNSMDVATAERFHRAIFLDYNAESWLRSFALKPYTFTVQDVSYTLSTRIPPILLNYINDVMLTEGNKAPFLIHISVHPDEGGSERTTSPRTWTLIADSMILDGLNEFIHLSQEELAALQEKAKKIFNDENRAFDVYMQNADTQIRLLLNQSPEFGVEGKATINEIVSKFVYYSMNRVTPQDIIFEYEKNDNRNKVEILKEKTGTILNLVIGIANELCSGVINDTFSAKELEIIAVRISTFFEDARVPSEDLMAYIHILKNKDTNDAVKEIGKILTGISNRYKVANSDYYYTGVNEISLDKKLEEKN